MNEPVQEVSFNQVLSILGSKEVEIQMLRATCAAQAARIKEIEEKLARLTPAEPPPPPAP